MWRHFALLAAVACGMGCAEREPAIEVPAQEGGIGQLLFEINDSTTIAIPGKRTGETLTLFNGSESIVCSALDSLCYTVPVFSGTLCMDGEGRGQWTDILRVGDALYTVPVRWSSIAPSTPSGTALDTTKWRLAFGTEDPWFGDLVLHEDDAGILGGTIETATGDFRFLHGSEENGNIVLQTFDGAHLFRFSCERTENRLVNGWFASGNHYSTPFEGERLNDDHLPLSSGQQAVWTGLPVAYSGYSMTRNPVDWKAAEHRDTVHILSVMGTWCPNCMDEHRLLRDLARQHPNVKVHTLAFERGLDRPNGEKLALRRLKNYHEEMELWRLDDRWDVTLAGPASKTEAQKKLPFLDKVVSFPTTIVLHPEQEEPWIHSGFNGPATGAKYDLERAALVAAINGRSESR